MNSKTTELTITRICNDEGRDSFWVKGTLGSALIEYRDGFWHIDQRTGGDSRECRTDRDSALMWAVSLCSTVLGCTYY